MPWKWSYISWIRLQICFCRHRDFVTFRICPSTPVMFTGHISSSSQSVHNRIYARPLKFALVPLAASVPFASYAIQQLQQDGKKSNRAKGEEEGGYLNDRRMHCLPVSLQTKKTTTRTNQFRGIVPRVCQRYAQTRNSQRRKWGFCIALSNK